MTDEATLVCCDSVFLSERAPFSLGHSSPPRTAPRRSTDRAAAATVTPSSAADDGDASFKFGFMLLCDVPLRREGCSSLIHC